MLGVYEPIPDLSLRAFLKMRWRKTSEGRALRVPDFPQNSANRPGLLQREAPPLVASRRKYGSRLLSVAKVQFSVGRSATPRPISARPSLHGFPVVSAPPYYCRPIDQQSCPVTARTPRDKSAGSSCFWRGR